METETLLVSAIVLSFNRKEETLECLTSLRRQTYPRVELVVLDNGSIDGSAEAIETQFPGVHLIRMPINYGDWQGRDIALRNCRGDYVLCVDNDATMESDLIEKFVKRMDAEPELGIIEPRVIDPRSRRAFSVSDELSTVTHYRSNFLGCVAMYRRNVLEQAGGFPHYLLGGAEVHLTLRVLDMDYRVLHMGNCTAYHLRSEKERIPHQRLYLQAKQRLRAYMAHYRWGARAVVDYNWKVISYFFITVKWGFWRQAFGDTLSLAWSGIAAFFRGRWKVKRETWARHDYLRLHVVKDYAEVEQHARPSNFVLTQWKIRRKGNNLIKSPARR